jgi:hypothetical protein
VKRGNQRSIGQKDWSRSSSVPRVCGTDDGRAEGEHAGGGVRNAGDAAGVVKAMIELT